MVPNLLFLFFFLLCLLIVKTQVYGTFVGVSIATVWLAKIGLYLLVFADVVITSGSLVIIVCLCVWWLLFRWVIKFLRGRSCFWSDLRKGMIKTLRPKKHYLLSIVSKIQRNFCLWNPESGKFFVLNSLSWALESWLNNRNPESRWRLESESQVPLTRNPDSFS